MRALVGGVATVNAPRHSGIPEIAAREESAHEISALAVANVSFTAVPGRNAARKINGRRTRGERGDYIYGGSFRRGWFEAHYKIRLQFRLA